MKLVTILAALLVSCLASASASSVVDNVAFVTTLTETVVVFAGSYDASSTEGRSLMISRDIGRAQMAEVQPGRPATLHFVRIGSDARIRWFARQSTVAENICEGHITPTRGRRDFTVVISRDGCVQH